MSLSSQSSFKETVRSKVATSSFQVFYRLFGLFLVIFLLFSGHLLYTSPNYQAVAKVAERPEQSEQLEQSEQQSPQRRAYATFFSTRVENDTVDDPYFTAVRVLTYQMLHHPVTRTQLGIPFLVLVPPHVSEYKRRILSSEGATILPIDLLLPSNNTFTPGAARYQDQFCKIRLFELTQYDRILYLDTDMLLTKSLDGIFDEPVSQEIRTTGTKQSHILPDEAPLPSTYLFTGVSDSGGAGHPFPPIEGDDINGGFWLIKPSLTLFTYYTSLMNIPDRFDSSMMEQSMLGYAHRREGNMPWTAFPSGKWNTNWPTEGDVDGGCASLHDKFWRMDNVGWIDRRVVEMWFEVKGMMVGFWQGQRLA